MVSFVGSHVDLVPAPTLFEVELNLTLIVVAVQECKAPGPPVVGFHWKDLALTYHVSAQCSRAIFSQGSSLAFTQPTPSCITQGAKRSASNETLIMLRPICHLIS